MANARGFGNCGIKFRALRRWNGRGAHTNPHPSTEIKFFFLPYFFVRVWPNCLKRTSRWIGNKRFVSFSVEKNKTTTHTLTELIHLPLCIKRDTLLHLLMGIGTEHCYYFRIIIRRKKTKKLVQRVTRLNMRGLLNMISIEFRQCLLCT
jgi:hypothetical protein